MILAAVFMTQAMQAAGPALPADTIINPTVTFNGLPRTYRIAGIRIQGADNYEEKSILGYTGLKVGDYITIPGDDINRAAKGLWRQGLFSNVRITSTRVRHVSRR